MADFKLEPGDVILTRDWTPVSWAIRFLEGDCDWSHACVYVGSDKIFTTGAHDLLWFGVVDAHRYLQGKPYCVLRPVQPLTNSEIAGLIRWNVMQIQDGNRYPLGTVIGLAIQKFFGKEVQHPAVTARCGTYCTQSVIEDYRYIGRNLLNENAHQDPAATTPEDLIESPVLRLVYRSDTA